VAPVDQIDQSCAQQIILSQGRLSGLHIAARNCRVSGERIPNAASRT
jgi:hypothetical protein